MEKEQAGFCTEFNISGEKFRNSRLTWAELDQIAEDFESKKNEHQDTVKWYVEAGTLIHKLAEQFFKENSLEGKIYFNDENVNYYEGDQKEIKGIRQIYYCLKYRNTNPQTLELFLNGLENGRKIYTAG